MAVFTAFPDLILMDGGRGQVNIALQVLDELHLNIAVCGMGERMTITGREDSITII